MMSSLNLTISSLNFIQDLLTEKPQKTFEDIKLHQELQEEKMTSEELILSRGYPLEIHYVETEDGYGLKLFRIPGNKLEKDYRNKQKEAILLVHGIFDSSDGWLCNSEDKCIPFILANLGYDVWLGNSRGNKHSKHHNDYCHRQKEFWNFSFHDMGMYDIPAKINHIKKINKHSEKIIYLGHSQGTAQVFAALTMNLEYFKKNVKLFIALGPVACVHNINSLALQTMEKLMIDILFEKLSFHEVLCSDQNMNKLSSWILPKIPNVSSLLVEIISDNNSSETNNVNMMPVFLSRGPSGSSLKAISHFVQCMRSKKFKRYDYGKKENLQLYGSEDPIEYDLKSITDFPIALFSGLGDKIATPKDVYWLKEQLGNNVILHNEYDLGHIGFIMANDMSWFNDVVNILELYR